MVNLNLLKKIENKEMMRIWISLLTPKWGI